MTTRFSPCGAELCLPLAATFSRNFSTVRFFLAEISKTISYVVMLSGALLDQARLLSRSAPWRSAIR